MLKYFFASSFSFLLSSCIACSIFNFLFSIFFSKSNDGSLGADILKLPTLLAACAGHHSIGWTQRGAPHLV
jgi:hypothetical protein